MSDLADTGAKGEEPVVWHAQNKGIDLFNIGFAVRHVFFIAINVDDFSNEEGIGGQSRKADIHDPGQKYCNTRQNYQYAKI